MFHRFYLRLSFFSGSRLKCVACRIIVHEGCIPLLNSYFICRQSYRESVRKYREQTSVEHHWVQRRNLKVLKQFYLYSIDYYWKMYQRFIYLYYVIYLINYFRENVNSAQRHSNQSWHLVLHHQWLVFLAHGANIIITTKANA